MIWGFLKWFATDKYDMSYDAEKESVPENKEQEQKVEIKLYGHLQKFTTGAMGLYKSWAK